MGMFRELDAFCAKRRSIFYPKADSELPDAILRLVPRDDFSIRNQITEVCRNALDTPVASVAPLSDPGTFHGLYRATLSDQRRVIVRINALSDVTRDFPLLLDPWVMKNLWRRALPALEIYKVDLSRRLAPFDYEILEEAPGVALKAHDADETATRRSLTLLGRVAGRLHRIRTTGYGFLDVGAFGDGREPSGLCATWADYLRAQLDRHVEICETIAAIDQQEARRIRAIFEDGCDGLENFEPALLHGDLGSHNVFAVGNKITALIDWEDCLSGDPVFEIAFWATFHPERRHDAFLEGYQSERTLPADFETRFWTYFLRIALSKTVLRHRLGLHDQPGRAPASQRIQRALMMLEGRDDCATQVVGGTGLMPDLTETVKLAGRIRAHTLRMVHKAKASHVGTCLSMTDILAVLYGSVMRVDPQDPEWEDRDRFILSKGHGAAAIYATLAERGFFPVEWLDTYCDDGTRLAGHITHHGVPGVELSSGSLGHGLSVGCGMALAGRGDGRSYRVFTLLSDGECDEGSIWEAILFAPHNRLDNLVCIVDYNKIQSFGTVREVLDLEPFADKWRACGWAVREIDGHDHQQIHDALSAVPFTPGKPSVILAHTIKGAGISFMENKLEWHYKSPDAGQLQQALQELGACA
jgi:transketolase